MWDTQESHPIANFAWPPALSFQKGLAGLAAVLRGEVGVLIVLMSVSVSFFVGHESTLLLSAVGWIPRRLDPKVRPPALMSSSAQAGELRRFQEHVVLGTCLLALKPLPVALQPRVVAFGGKGGKARPSVQPHHTLQPFEGPLPQETLLPVACLLLSTRPVPQGAKLSSGVGLDYSF